MTVLDKMIMTDLFKTVFSVLLVVVVIIVSRKFIKVLAEAIEGNIANETVMAMLGLKIVVATTTFLPAALFMGVLMVLGRMYRDQEMAAVASAGGGVRTLYRAVLWFALPVAALAGWLSLQAAPWAEARMQQLTHQDQENADLRGISAGRFSEYSDGELIFYAEDIDNDGTMHRVFVQNKEKDQFGVVSAAIGRLQDLEGGLYLVLQQGERIKGIPGQKNFTIENFGEYGVRIEKKTTVLRLGRESVKTEQLWDSEKRRDIAELQTRLSIPSSALFLSLLAVPLARMSPRSGVYGSLLFAFGIYFIHGNLQRVGHSWVISGKLPVWLGYFWVDLLLVLVTCALLLHASGWHRTWFYRNKEARA
jgi:lipopolysaccharide export system permease protein